ncbi:MAG: hypothetical protein ACMUIP_05220 [bacterium]
MPYLQKHTLKISVNKCILLILVLCLCISRYVFAQDTIDEDELFSSPDSIFTTEKIIDNTILEEEKKTIGISGEAISVIEFSGTRDFIKDGDDKDNALSSYIQGTLFFDARLKRGLKCFANMEMQYNPNADGDMNFDGDQDAQEADIFLQEFFIDFNVQNSVYFRAGKQVLQWGRCYLWNPSDLINVEKKSFKEKIGAREGAYGIKMHKPYGTQYNIYSFLDIGDDPNSNEIGVAFKLEFLLGRTEMAFSTWNKKGYGPVYAYDFSTRILGIDTMGEAALSHETTIDEPIEDRWIPRVCINFGKSFDCMDIHDRISMNLECYYNDAGLTATVLSEAEWISLLSNNRYEANNVSKYYVALFTTTRKFILSDMNLILNLIRNLNDESSILTAGITYTDIHDFSIGLTVYSYLGTSNCEYTFQNNAITTQLIVGILF